MAAVALAVEYCCLYFIAFDYFGFYHLAFYERQVKAGRRPVHGAFLFTRYVLSATLWSRYDEVIKANISAFLVVGAGKQANIAGREC